ncbi:MAG: MaoC family dehydratase [Dehalococcoidia bacterium]|nr:MaoC family dehydratase [Dehalococcoidia bacterium]
MADDEARILTMTVERGKIAEFARAIGDNNPIYFDQTKARAAGFADIPAPPTFYEVWLRFIDFGGDRPRPQRTQGGPEGGSGFDGGREIEYLKPLIAGDVVTMTKRDGSPYEREGRRGGKLTFKVEKCELTNQRGEKVMVVRNITVSTSKVPGER